MDGAGVHGGAAGAVPQLDVRSLRQPNDVLKYLLTHYNAEIVCINYGDQRVFFNFM